MKARTAGSFRLDVLPPAQRRVIEALIAFGKATTSIRRESKAADEKHTD